MPMPLSSASPKKRAFAAVAAATLLSVSVETTYLNPVWPQQAAPAKNDPTGIYIPADKRHKGLSRFDSLPFTDRKLGDPDRYRALNPNFVQHENGQYYFLLDAQPNTPYFDDDLKPKGVLTETTNVPTDLTKWKDVKTGDASGRKAVRYVYVKNKGYVLRSRLTPTAEIHDGKWFQFPLKVGVKHSLCDGTGIVRGTLAVKSVRLNYGQQKQINGETCYYAFATSIVLNETNEKSGASGWIKASALQAGNDPHYGTEVVQKMQPPSTDGPFTRYELTGGDAREKWSDGDIATGGGTPIYKWGYLDAKGQFVAYKVLPGVSLAGRASVASTDYIKRNDDVINLGFNACGVSNDTYRVSSAKRPLFFYRSPHKDATVVVDLFYPEDALHSGQEIVGKMLWVYGYVEEKSGKRWGWVPLGALALRQKP